jgi:hypothetical protein
MSSSHHRGKAQLSIWVTKSDGIQPARAQYVFVTARHFLDLAAKPNILD